MLWKQHLSGLTIDQSVQRFVADFNIPPDQARRDIEATFAQWRDTGLLSSPNHSEREQSSFVCHPAAVSLDCILAGKRFRILVAPELLDEICPRIKHLAANFDKPDFTIPISLTPDGLPTTARILLLEEMTRLCRPDRHFRATLHAGACGNDSACILLAGPTHSGKTTLCAALMQAGFTCYSDDSSLLDQNFDVAGMPFPLMLRPGSWGYFPQIQQFPSYTRWGSEVRFLPNSMPPQSPSVPPKVLLFVQYSPDSPSSLDRITTFESLLLLQQSGFWVEHTQDGIATFLGWLGTIPRYRYSYSDFSNGLSTFASLLASDSALHG